MSDTLERDHLNALTSARRTTPVRRRRRRTAVKRTAVKRTAVKSSCAQWARKLPSLVAATLAVIVLGDVSALVLSGRPVPELLSNLVFGVFGFYFGRRTPASAPACALACALEPPRCRS